MNQSKISAIDCAFFLFSCVEKAIFLKNLNHACTSGWHGKLRIALCCSLFILVFFCFSNLSAQEDKTRFVVGLSGPELLHAGITYRLANSSQIGLNAGAGPSMGEIWTSISLEHRLYIGKNSEKSKQKTWFFRQGTTFFPSATISSQLFTLNATIGKDLPFKDPTTGMTIDLGVFHLPDSENSSLILIRSLNLWPALRFQLYFQ